MGLNGKQRKHLRGLAHGFDPVLHIGHAGVSDTVVASVSEALTARELIKVRLHEPHDKKAMARDLAERTGAELCGLVGHTIILFRRNAETPRIELPEGPDTPGV